MARHIGLKPQPKPVPTPALPVEAEETILPEVTEEVVKAVKRIKKSAQAQKTN